MIKKLKFWLVATAALTIQSCSVNTETTYYPDTSSSLESHIKVDQMLMGMMKSQDTNTAQLQKFPNEWKSLYDIQKNQKIIANPDSSAVLKKVFMKVNKTNNEIYEISFKYNQLKPQEIASAFSRGDNKRLMALQNIGSWNGKQLIIDTEKFSIADRLEDIESSPSELNKNPSNKQDSLKAYGKQMTSGLLGALKMFNVNITNTIKFQKPIKSIEGKHDFVEQIDKKTVRVKVRTSELLEEGKTLKNRDKKIIITTE